MEAFTVLELYEYNKICGKNFCIIPSFGLFNLYFSRVLHIIMSIPHYKISPLKQSIMTFNGCIMIFNATLSYLFTVVTI